MQNYSNFLGENHADHSKTKINTQLNLCAYKSVNLLVLDSVFLKDASMHEIFGHQYAQYSFKLRVFKFTVYMAFDQVGLWSSLTPVIGKSNESIWPQSGGNVPYGSFRMPNIIDR